MTRIWMLCLLTALLHSAAYAAKPNAENPAKGKPAAEAAKSDKPDIDPKAPDDEDLKAPPKSKKKKRAKPGFGDGPHADSAVRA